MKAELAPSLTAGDVLLYVLAYLRWFISTAVCIIAVIELRSAVNVLWVTLGGDRYALGLVNQVTLLLGGFAAFVYVILLESVYRASVAPTKLKPAVSRQGSAPVPAWPGRRPWWRSDSRLGTLLQRFAITIAVPLGLLAVFPFLHELAWRLMQ